MQLCAFNNESKVVFSSHALKHQDYFCIECSSKVRLRGGVHRRLHFYHLESAPSCRLNGKSETHLEIQLFFLNLLGEKECFLERRFKKINRIADVVWEKQKIIFEIQCSLISAQEVKNRNNDYLSLGYQVIWILHERRFNQRRLSAAESYLLSFPHYYTNMNEQGLGTIYDQLSFELFNYRVAKSNPLSLVMNQIKSLTPSDLENEDLKFHQNLKSYFSHRYNQNFYFSGSVIERCLGEEKNHFESLLIDWTERFSEEKKKKKIYFLAHLKRLYLTFFRLLLEKV